MHHIEPFWNWRDRYTAETDERSPFFEREYNEFEFDRKIYNYYIHPQWDEFGSETLYIKILFANYEQHFVILELIGEWNDTLYNDIMWLKNEVIDCLIKEGIHKYVLIGENILNFHGSDESYYEAWHEDIDANGWIYFLNFRDHVIDEMKRTNLENYVVFSGHSPIDWRTYKPEALIETIDLAQDLSVYELRQ